MITPRRENIGQQIAEKVTVSETYRFTYIIHWLRRVDSKQNSFVDRDFHEDKMQNLETH